MRSIRARLAIAALLGAALPAQAASTFSADISDLWWNPGESGWGVNIMQQADVLFATFFVYSADGTAHWYVASELGNTGTSGTTQTFSGSLFETTGPVVLSTPFNPAAVARRAVGAATVQYTPPNSVMLTYSADGQSVTKTLQRQTWRANDINGRFANIARVVRGCSGTSVIDFPGEMTVMQSGASVSISMGNGENSLMSCAYNGTYTPMGRLGAISGTFSCTAGITPLSGTFTMSELEVSRNGFMGRLEQSDGRCTATGHIAAIRWPR